MHQRISQGDIPEDLVLLGRQPAPLNPIAAEKAGKSLLRSRMVAPMTGMAIGGSAVGMIAGASLTPLLPLGTDLMLPIAAGVAVGAVAGLLFGIDAVRDLQGKVEVDLNGQKSMQNWKGDADLRARSAEEISVTLKALGELGDTIEPHSPKWEGQVDPNRAAFLKEKRPQLLELAQQRKLVADLGQSSQYGKPALHLVDAQAAKELWSRGYSVYMLDGGKTSDQSHQLKTTAFTGTRNEVSVDDYSYLERTYNYQLRDLGSLEPSQSEGLPEGMVGVYRDSEEFSQILQRSWNQAQKTLLPEQTLQQSRSQMANRLEHSPTKASSVEQMLAGFKRNSARSAAITGSILGACTTGLLGLDPSLGLAVGGAGGYLLGRASIGGSQVAKGLMMTAGGAVGAALALHGGVQASLAVGTFGGFLSAAYVASKVAPDKIGTSAELGLIGGSALGLAAAFTGQPWLSLPLAAVGLVGGVALGKATV